jgi:hypothetical protein
VAIRIDMVADHIVLQSGGRRFLQTLRGKFCDRRFAETAPQVCQITQNTLRLSLTSIVARQPRAQVKLDAMPLPGSALSLLSSGAAVGR